MKVFDNTLKYGWRRAKEVCPICGGCRIICPKCGRVIHKDRSDRPDKKYQCPNCLYLGELIQ